VTNVANSYRLQEECDVLSLVLAKYKGEINLPEFKAVMLSSLRSLVPKDWDSVMPFSVWTRKDFMQKTRKEKKAKEQAEKEMADA